jgi:hypothetical protein
MKAPCITNFSVLIGIDWADKKHDVCEIDLKVKSPRYSVIASKPEAIHDWAMSLKQRFPDKPVAVACELKKGPLIYCLEKYDHIVIFPFTLLLSPGIVKHLHKAVPRMIPVMRSFKRKSSNDIWIS